MRRARLDMMVKAGEGRGWWEVCYLHSTFAFFDSSQLFKRRLGLFPPVRTCQTRAAIPTAVLGPSSRL